MLVIFVFGLAMRRVMTMDVLALAVVAPLIPAILWEVREIQRYSLPVDDLGRLQSHFHRERRGAQSRSLTEIALEAHLSGNIGFDVRAKKMGAPDADDITN